MNIKISVVIVETEVLEITKHMWLYRAVKAFAYLNIFNNSSTFPYSILGFCLLYKA